MVNAIMPTVNYQKPVAYCINHLKVVSKIYPHDPL